MWNPGKSIPQKNDSIQPGQYVEATSRIEATIGDASIIREVCQTAAASREFSSTHDSR